MSVVTIGHLFFHMWSECRDVWAVLCISFALCDRRVIVVHDRSPLFGLIEMSKAVVRIPMTTYDTKVNTMHEYNLPITRCMKRGPSVGI